MIVEDHYPFDRSAALPALCYPRPILSSSHNSEEKKNEKSEVLVCFYPMY